MLQHVATSGAKRRCQPPNALGSRSNSLGGFLRRWILSETAALASYEIPINASCSVIGHALRYQYNSSISNKNIDFSGVLVYRITDDIRSSW